MLIFKLLIIFFFCVFYGQETVGAAKRVKRNFETDGNRTKVTRDFAVVDSAANKETKTLATDLNVNNKVSRVTNDKQAEPNKETVSYYDEMLHNLDSPLKKRKIPPHSSHSITNTRNTHTTRGRNVAAVLENLRRTPMAYIFHEQENKFPEYVDHFVAATTGQTNDKHKEAPAEVVIIDNAPNVIPSMKDHINLHQCVEKSSKRLEGDKERNDETKYILKGLSHILNLPDERNRAFSATANTKMIDNQFIPIHNPLIGGNAFTPLESMFKLANMIMYNMGNEDSIPMRAQSAQMAFVPYTPFNQPDLLQDDPESIDYILNVIGSPTDVYNAVIAKSAVGQQPDALQQALNKNEHNHDAALIFKQPVAANDNKVVDLIENALDTLLSSSSEVDNNNEIEVRCPIHREQKHIFAENASGDSNATKENKDGADVIQVCSCHFVQKKKADSSTPIKTTN